MLPSDSRRLARSVPSDSLQRGLCAAIVGLLLLMAMPTPVAAGGQTVWSDDGPMRPLNIHWVALDGERAEQGRQDVDAGNLRFEVRSPPKGLTFDGTFHSFAESDVVLVHGFTGALFVSEGNVKFAGTADGWTLCDDRDMDGLDSCDEVLVHGTDPDDADSDDDGLIDGAEVLHHGTDPLDSDSDDDRLTDGEEVDGQLATGPTFPATDPTNADTDSDGLDDGDEVLDHGTDPTDADTDDGGSDDATEIGRGTDPLDPSDDHFLTLHTVSGQGQGLGWMDIEFAGPDHQSAFFDGEAADYAGDLVFQPDGGQWLELNGTETFLEDGFRVEVFGFRGTLQKSMGGVNGTQDVLFLDGIAQSYRVRNFTNEDEVARGKIVIESDGEEGVLHIRVANVVNDEEVPVMDQTIDHPVPMPVYFEFDVWKNPDNIADVGVFHVQMRPGTYEGQPVTYITVYNEDPMIYTGMVPVPLPVGACVQTPPEFNLGLCG